MSGNWKKYVLVVADLLLVAYLASAFTVFNKPDETMRVCTKANFAVLDDISDGTRRWSSGDSRSTTCIRSACR